MAKASAAAGAEVGLYGWNDDAVAQAAASECGASIVFGDLADDLPACVERIMADAVALCPQIDLLVCNAGTYLDRPFLEMDYDTFDRTMKLNVCSQFVLIQAFVRRWVDQGVSGRIVVTGSINGRLAEPTHVAYDTSKGAVESMVRSLAVTLAPMGIRVNGVAPGLFETPLTAPALNSGGLRDWMQLHTPNGQVPGPEVIGGAPVSLLRDAAGHLAGPVVLVECGMSGW